MKDYCSVKEMARRWGKSERMVAILCKSGVIDGAVKTGHEWRIPADAVLPADRRIKNGNYRTVTRPARLPLPVGISDYRIASTEYYYVDKTMLIRDFLDEKPMVSLFTRPRRFGKTLNMDMLKTFFEHTDEDTSVYFKDKQIWKQGSYYQSYQGKYPVVFVTFKDVKCETWEATQQKLGTVIGNEYQRHMELLNSDKCSAVDKEYFRSVMERRASITELSDAFMTLTKMLHEHYSIAPVMIIDEYDTPIQQGHTKDFYDQIILFMRNLFSGGLKDNRHLSFGFLTGILRVAKESIFSGLNNLVINSILDQKYSSYFGFTPEEVRAMAAYYGNPDCYDELCEWYDGYQFGNSEVFNPWSVTNYFRNDCTPGAYWQSTGNNEIIGKALAEAGPDIYDRLQRLLQGESFLASIDTDVIYPEIRKNPSSVFSFLLVAGYLKALHSDSSFSNGFLCEVALPNKEIKFVYKKEILDHLNEIVSPSVSSSLQEALFSGNTIQLQENMQKLLHETVSSFDTSEEIFYQGLVLGLCAMMDSRYTVRSNRESGDGRYDIQLSPGNNRFPGILIELKSTRKQDAASLKKLANAAVSQILDKHYDTEMKAQGVTSILCYGVAFCGKDVEIALSICE